MVDKLGKPITEVIGQPRVNPAIKRPKEEPVPPSHPKPTRKTPVKTNVSIYTGAYLGTDKFIESSAKFLGVSDQCVADILVRMIDLPLQIMEALLSIHTRALTKA